MFFCVDILLIDIFYEHPHRCMWVELAIAKVHLLVLTLILNDGGFSIVKDISFLMNIVTDDKFF